MVQSVLFTFVLALVGTVAVEARGMQRSRAPESLTRHRRAVAKDYVYSMNNPWEGFNATKWEPYVRYHARYMAINCPKEHGTEFFETCCKLPRLATKPDDADYPKACSEAVAGAPTPDKAAAVIESKIYAPLVADGQVGFGGGAAKNTTTTNPKSSKTNPKKAEAAAAKKAAAQKAADEAAAQAKKEADAAAAKAAADKAAAEKKAAQEAADKQAEEEKKKKEQEQSQQQSNNNGDDGDDSGSSSSGGGGIFAHVIGPEFDHGEATWYTQDGTAGACGQFLPDSDKIIALSSSLYGDFGTTSKYCGKKVAIENLDNGKSVIATVADGCPGCDESHIDLSVGAFNAIGDPNTGVLNIKWAFIA